MSAAVVLAEPMLDLPSREAPPAKSSISTCFSEVSPTEAAAESSPSSFALRFMKPGASTKPFISG